MQRNNNLAPIKEESSLTDSRVSQSVNSNVLVLEPKYCPCIKFFREKPKGKDPCSDKSYSSILDKPFLFRRDESLNMAVQLQEKNLMARYAYLDQGEEEGQDEPQPISSEVTFESLTSSVTATTSTICEPSVHKIESDQDRLQYLLELGKTEPEEEISALPEEYDKGRKLQAEEVTETEAMRLAQKYLRTHKIFEFFQFLIAHLLSSLPENPIRFLLSLLDKCIIYRAGMSNPPLLYEKRHIGALFDLMDPMRTGYIDLDQYVTGMKTLGICSFKRNPPITKEKMVYKQIFVDEAYENLVNLLDDLLKRRWINYKAGTVIPPLNTPPPTLTRLSTKTSAKTVSPKTLQDIYLNYEKDTKSK